VIYWAHCFWGCGEAAHHGREYVSEEHTTHLLARVTKRGEEKGTGVLSCYPLLGRVLNDIGPSTRLHLLKFLLPPNSTLGAIGNWQGQGKRRAGLMESSWAGELSMPLTYWDLRTSVKYFFSVVNSHIYHQALVKYISYKGLFPLW
jgi:hypothetical protein